MSIMKVDYGDVGGNTLDNEILSTISTTESTRIDLGYRPKILVLKVYNNARTYYTLSAYFDDKPTELFISRPDWTVYGTNPIASGYNGYGFLYQVDDTGFTICKGNNGYCYDVEYWAVK